MVLISARTGEGHERDRMSAEHLENQQAILSEAAERSPLGLRKEETIMKRTWIIAAALFATVLATPAMAACVDWKAILELDATISAEIRSETETAEAKGEEPNPSLLEEDAYHRLDVIHDKADALDGKCHEHVR